MTGPSGNRLFILPLEIHDRLPRLPILTSAAPRSVETLGEVFLNLSGQTGLPITLEASHCLFNICRLNSYF